MNNFRYVELSLLPSFNLRVHIVRRSAYLIAIRTDELLRHRNKECEVYKNVGYVIEFSTESYR